ncbi:heme-degrading domain-containing protein [Litoreibacter albidus]|uniref:Uncharacterized protein, UPF0303 family n=1 Tax=Litoreibacter albidus TaxID=670155 RepID=A0A1H3CTK5_9RHOB|nr:heme-degrading domain-containing protein [Litoreibacter albidus]SDX57477.1 Uncharacterized protein, UPF0303 family [Litoreibacter albidus]
MTPHEMPDEDLLRHIADQEARIVFRDFSMARALEVGQALVAKAQAANAPVVVDITRTGQVLFHCALEGATPDNAQWVIRKNRVVDRFRHSSLYMGAFCRIAGVTLEQKYMLPANRYAAHGGAFPIIVEGAGVIGTVTVSGLPQIEDHELVVSVLSEFV